MFEQILNNENKNQEYNYSEQKNVNLIIQFIVDGYLKSKGQPLMKELLEEYGLENKAGLIYNFHIMFLQFMFAEELLLVNVNLADEVNKTGEKYELGKLSQFETKYLDNRIASISGLIEIIRDKVNK